MQIIWQNRVAPRVRAASRKHRSHFIKHAATPHRVHQKATVLYHTIFRRNLYVHTETTRYYTVNKLMYNNVR